MGGAGELRQGKQNEWLAASEKSSGRPDNNGRRSTINKTFTFALRGCPLRKPSRRRDPGHHASIDSLLSMFFFVYIPSSSYTCNPQLVSPRLCSWVALLPPTVQP